MISIYPFLGLAFLLHVTRVSAFGIPLNDTDKNGCTLGQEFRGGSCKLCRPGTYRFIAPKGIPTRDPFQCLTDDDLYNGKIPPSNSRCEKCPPGTYNPFPGAKTPLRCRGCQPGTISGKGARKCRKCPWGKSSALGSPVCATCKKGWFLTRPCRNGVRPSKLCSICPKGTYTDSKNSNECRKCPDGTSTAKRGSTSKNMCKPCGTNGVRCSCQQQREPWNAVSSYRPIGHSVCTRCPAGTRAKSPFATSAKECIPCPKGTSYVFLEGCKKCAEGEKSFGSGASYCRKKSGDKCPFDSIKDKSGVCKLCPTGYKISGQKCVKCPSGTVSQGFTSKTCGVCIFPNVAPPNDGFCSCGPGYFKDFDDTYNCMPCPKGTTMDSHYHENGRCNADCENFPNQPACIPCKLDYERDYNTQTCKKCPKGLRSFIGEEYCENPQTGCPAGYILEVGDHRFGYSISCTSYGGR